MSLEGGDFGVIGDYAADGGGANHGERDVHLGAGTGGERAGQDYGDEVRLLNGPERIVALGEGHVGGDVVHHLDVRGGQDALVEDLDTIADLVATMHAGGL